jgi:predicted RNase H-like HicB family nuclease
MKYRVLLVHNDEGYAVGCPALPGCWSQGATREEALANIQDAMQNVLEVQAELKAEVEAASLRAQGLDVETEEIELLAHA